MPQYTKHDDPAGSKQTTYLLQNHLHHSLGQWSVYQSVDSREVCQLACGHGPNDRVRKSAKIAREVQVPPTDDALERPSALGLEIL